MPSPEKPLKIIIPSLDEVRLAVRKMEEKAGSEIRDIQRKVPAWSPELAEGIMMLPSRRMPE